MTDKASKCVEIKKQGIYYFLLNESRPAPENGLLYYGFPRSLRDVFRLSNITAHKVALSGDNVREHGLPSDLEAKVSSPNYQKFVSRHVVHVAELDAAPVALLQGKLRDAIESCLDMDLFG